MSKSGSRISKTVTSGAAQVRIEGVIDEHLDADALISGLPGVVVFDLAGVERITSFGVREWVNALRALKANYCAFIRCRPAIVTQFNMVSNFGLQGELVSFYAPFVCTSCDADTEQLIDLRNDDVSALVDDVPPMRCPECGGDAEFDDIPELYFAYAATKPAPLPPPIAQQLIDGRARPARGSTLDLRKEVDGDVTAIWLSGSIDDDVHVKRLFDGLEGEVVLEFSEVHTAKPEGVKKLLLAASAEGRSVQLARLPQPVQEALADHAKWGLSNGIKIISVLFPVRCRCLHDQDIPDVRIGSLDETAGIPELACAKCGARVEQEAPPEVSTLAPILGSPSPLIGTYLRRRRSSLSSDTVTPWNPLPRNRRKYSPIRFLAQGGMAEVYLARQSGPEGFEKIVVVKRVLSTRSRQASALSMFLQEARIAARVTHPNVVHTLDLGQDNRGFFLVLEYVEGWNLNQILSSLEQRGARLPLGIACRIMSEVSAGLAAAHSLRGLDGKPLGVVHRDVSPHNILLSRIGVAKIGDFGIATIADAFSLESTAEGLVKGKLAYMSPEQLAGSGSLDSSSDVFSAALVLYRCITGQHPFQRETREGTAYAVLTHRAPPLSNYRKDIPEELEKLVQRGLAKDPNDRFASGVELQRALDKVLLIPSIATTASDVAMWLRENMPHKSIPPLGDATWGGGSLDTLNEKLRES